MLTRHKVFNSKLHENLRTARGIYKCHEMRKQNLKKKLFSWEPPKNVRYLDFSDGP